MIKTIINQKMEENKCRCGSLFAHWKKFSRQDIRSCPIKGCSGTDLQGKFVNKAETSDTTTYIIPLCSEHAKSTEALEIIEALKFVSADFKMTCGNAPGKSEEANML
jgi:hypothetical protein